jgi:hypothetical protein
LSFKFILLFQVNTFCVLGLKWSVPNVLRFVGYRVLHKKSEGTMAGYQRRDEMDNGLSAVESAQLFHQNDDTTVDTAKSSSSFGGAVLGIGGVVVFSVVAITGYSVVSNGPAMKMYSSSSSVCDDMKVTASNEYGVFSAPYPYLMNGEMLVEPYKATTVAASFTDGTDADTYSYSWTIGSDVYSGSSITATMTTPGTYSVSVDVTDDSSNTCTFTTTAYVKYVKRELRSLTEADRNKALDASYTLWKYSAEEGQALYGDAYTPLQTFVEEHALASNDILCDQYHEGTGFLTHHLAMGLSFEASVRSVDPSVTIPYWDFSIEGEYVTQMDGVPSDMLKMTPFFSEDWFGSVDEDNHIADGRWAHAAMPATSDADLTHNSYGYIRSYWNNNNDPEISRSLFNTCGVEPEHKTIPNCKIHFSVLDSEDLGTFQSLSPGDGHGPLHVQTGGVWGGCTEAFANLTTKWADLLNTDVTTEEVEAAGLNAQKFFNKWGESGQRLLMLDTAVLGEYFHIYRSLWRSHTCAADKMSGYLVCPDSCSLDTPFEECSCQVDALVNGETTTDNLLGCVLNDDNQVFFKAAFPDEFIADLVTMTATASVLEGEMVESASTADPLFWYIHPVIERLLQAKRLPDVTSMGSQSFSKWDDYAGNSQSFKEYSFYSFDSGVMPFHEDEYVCTGHMAADRALPARLSLTPVFDTNGADIDGDGVISNYEFYLALDPTDPEKNDYVFDNFDWSHCA